MNLPEELIWRDLTKAEKDNAIKCKVTKPNKMACDRCAVAVLVVIPDGRENLSVCNFHLTLAQALAEKDGFRVMELETEDGSSPNYTESKCEE